jgi:hypothetical protein
MDNVATDEDRAEVAAWLEEEASARALHVYTESRCEEGATPEQAEENGMTAGDDQVAALAATEGYRVEGTWDREDLTFTVTVIEATEPTNEE